MTSTERAALRKWAYAHADTVREQTIRLLARERGGINDRTRTGIFAEAEARAQKAREQVFINAGYGRCQSTTPMCPALTTPGYKYCPKHEQKKPVNPATQQAPGLVYAGTSPFIFAK